MDGKVNMWIDAMDGNTDEIRGKDGNDCLGMQVSRKADECMGKQMKRQMEIKMKEERKKWLLADDSTTKKDEGKTDARMNEWMKGMKKGIKESKIMTLTKQ